MSGRRPKVDGDVTVIAYSVRGNNARVVSISSPPPFNTRKFILINGVLHTAPTSATRTEVAAVLPREQKYDARKGNHDVTFSFLNWQTRPSHSTTGRNRLDDNILALSLVHTHPVLAASESEHNP